MKKSYLFIFLAIVLLAFVYLKFIHPPFNDQVKFLTANNYTTGTVNQISLLGADFVFAWYKAAKKGALTFQFSGKTYKTQGGTAI